MRKLFSKILTVSITLNPCLAQDGHDIIFTPLFFKFNGFNISLPIFTSSIDHQIKIFLLCLQFHLKVEILSQWKIYPGKTPASVIP